MKKDRPAKLSARDQQRCAPGNRPVEEFLDAHRREADRAASARCRQTSAAAANPSSRRAASPVRRPPPPRTTSRSRTARARTPDSCAHVGPDQAEREKVDDEHRPQRRNAQHRDTRDASWSRLPCCPTDRPKLAPPGLPPRQSPLSCGQGASAPLNGLSPRSGNPNRGFKLMKSARVAALVKHDARDALHGDRERSAGDGVSVKNRVKMHNSCG